MNNKPLREIVAGYMHPWLEPGPNGTLRVPSMSTIFQAADQLIEGLDKNGFKIMSVEEMKCLEKENARLRDEMNMLKAR
jgi:hypothetical protein